MNLGENYPPGKWRILLSSPASGIWNMAVDEAILEAVGRTEVYSWDPPCVSIGVAQSSQDIDSGCLNSQGWEFVRRPTGGRALLHTDEITYAIMAPQVEPRVAGGVMESYLRLSRALLASLRALNMPAIAEESN